MCEMVIKVEEINKEEIWQRRNLVVPRRMTRAKFEYLYCKDKE